eukprot:TRINITY_DN471_c1_g1_i18.p1 TRINITY_DN471_c1_g1~~TRINITY_DN471_c1_g1_i18.p1  ORF type:complete len:416 (+),score=37.73 TRINITY_DN471_c1_g1_i18:328-1575(+)
MGVTEGLKVSLDEASDTYATIYGDRRKTWSEFYVRVQKMAGVFRKLAPGIVKGGRVAIAALNSDIYCETIYATSWAGGVTTCVNFLLEPQDIIYQLVDSSPQLLVIDDTLKSLAKMSNRLPSLKGVIFIGEGPTPPGCLGYEDLLARTSIFVSDVGRTGSDNFAILYMRVRTTTGKPKRIVLSHDNASVGRLRGTKSMTAIVFLHCPPFFLFSSVLALAAVTSGGGTHVIPRSSVSKFDPVLACQTCESAKVNITIMRPPLLQQLVSLPNDVRQKFNLTSMQKIYYGTAALESELEAHTLLLFPNAEVNAGYGLSRRRIPRPGSPNSSRSEATLTEGDFEFSDGSLESDVDENELGPLETHSELIRPSPRPKGRSVVQGSPRVAELAGTDRSDRDGSPRRAPDLGRLNLNEPDTT